MFYENIQKIENFFTNLCRFLYESWTYTDK